MYFDRIFLDWRSVCLGSYKFCKSRVNYILHKFVMNCWYNIRKRQCIGFTKSGRTFEIDSVLLFIKYFKTKDLIYYWKLELSQFHSKAELNCNYFSINAIQLNWIERIFFLQFNSAELNWSKNNCWIELQKKFFRKKSKNNYNSIQLLNWINSIQIYN